jgi:hypothetical protein
MLSSSIRCQDPPAWGRLTEGLDCFGQYPERRIVSTPGSMPCRLANSSGHSNFALTRKRLVTNIMELEPISLERCPAWQHQNGVHSPN